MMETDALVVGACVCGALPILTRVPTLAAVRLVPGATQGKEET